MSIRNMLTGLSIYNINHFIPVDQTRYFCKQDPDEMAQYESSCLELHCQLFCSILLLTPLFTTLYVTNSMIVESILELQG